MNDLKAQIRGLINDNEEIKLNQVSILNENKLERLSLTSLSILVELLGTTESLVPSKWGAPEAPERCSTRVDSGLPRKY